MYIYYDKFFTKNFVRKSLRLRELRQSPRWESNPQPQHYEIGFTKIRLIDLSAVIQGGNPQTPGFLEQNTAIIVTHFESLSIGQALFFGK